LIFTSAFALRLARLAAKAHDRAAHRRARGRRQARCVRRGRCDHLNYLVDGEAAVGCGHADVFGKLGRIALEDPSQRVGLKSRLRLVSSQRDRFAEHEPGVLALLEQCELFPAGLLRKLARRGVLELPAYVGLDSSNARGAAGL
jgi:hypothetical protein